VLYFSVQFLCEFKTVLRIKSINSKQTLKALGALCFLLGDRTGEEPD
jgi:hypothetical protein